MAFTNYKNAISFATLVLAMASTLFAAPLEGATEVESFSNGHAIVPGQASWYNPSVGTSSCGAVHQDSELVAALPIPVMGQYPSPHCGKNVKVTTKDGQASVTVKVVDACGGCGNAGYENVVIDLSPAAFQKLAPLVKGRVDVSYDWV